MRTEFLDDQTHAFAARHPEACVLTIGAGLCTPSARPADQPVLGSTPTCLPSLRYARQCCPAEADPTAHGCSAADADGIADIVQTLHTSKTQPDPALVVLGA